MRGLTENEGRVAGVLLSTTAESEGERIRAAGVPRTTYQAVRQRALAAGWLQLRYVPHPDLLGPTRVRLTLAQPYAEEVGRRAREAAADPRQVLLWSSPESLLSVRFEAPAPGDPDEPEGSEEGFRRRWTVAADAGDGAVPAYFDFEGAWSQGLLGRAPRSYPTGLSQGRGLPPPRLRLSSRPVREAALELLRRPGGAPPRPAAPGFSWFGPARIQQRLQEDGWVARRFFLDLERLPPIAGRRIERVVFVTGLPRSGGSGEELLRSLVEEAGVHPFLFARDRRRVLFATLAPLPLAPATPRPSILGLVERRLSNIEIVREPVASLHAVVDHRYDGLLEAVGPGGSPPRGRGAGDGDGAPSAPGPRDGRAPPSTPGTW